MEEIRMKLFKKVMSVMTLLFVVFAMTGCAQLLSKLAGKIEEETPEPELSFFVPHLAEPYSTLCRNFFASFAFR